MPLWEYKVLTSGPHGFASPALLESHLNALGKDEWEIIYFQTLPNNALAFHGLARRSTTRDWTPPEPVVSIASKAPAYEPPFAPSASKPVPAASVTAEEKPTSIVDEAEAPAVKPEKTSIRTMRDTERDLDPDAEEEEDDWDNWEEEQDDLPTFFEAIKPHLRRNQKGPGMSVAVDYLAKRWDQREADLVGALKECSFTIPETEDADPEYFEFEGDLYWVNRNNRGQLFINTREKPRPTFRTAPAKKVAADDPTMAEITAERAAEKLEIEKRRLEREERQAAAAAAQAAAAEKAKARAAAHAQAQAGANATTNAPTAESGAPLPGGPELLERIKPLMRRNRRGPGYSGSTSFLARALKQSEGDLVAAFAALGLNAPSNAADKPVFVEIGDAVYWINKDSRGGIWINGREKRDGAPKGESENGAAPEKSAEPTSDIPAASPSEPAAPATSETPPAEETLAGPAIADQETDKDAPASSEQQTESPFPAEDAPVATGAGDQPALTAVRPLLKANKRGSGVSGEIGFLARALEKAEEEFLSGLTQAGLAVPIDSEAKPVFVEQGGEIFWINKNSTDGSLWLNAKPAKSSRRSSGSRTRAPRKPKAES